MKKRRAKRAQPTGHKRGRPSVYSVELAERAHALAQQGATDQEIADGLEIGTTTFYRWCHEHPEFREVTRLGKDAADDRVEQSLYHRSVGYSHQAVKIFMPAGASDPVYAPYVERFPPDTAAASLWLRNRRPDKWRDKVDHELSGPGGGPIAVQRVERVVVDPSKPSPADTDGEGVPPAAGAGEV